MPSNYLTELDAPLREVGQRVHAVVEAALPEATGALWHGHPVWGLGDRPGRQPVCLLKAQSTYVTFGLWRGRTSPTRPGGSCPARGGWRR